MSDAEINVGAMYRAPYPFRIDAYIAFDEEGCGAVPTWIPGVRQEPRAPDGVDSDCIADGLGFMCLHVVSLHKPGKFPPRVFYVRTWEDPNGRVFGKKSLRMTTLAAFRRLLRGYRHEYELKTGKLREAA